ncbi:DUF3667 domain-containing protein [Pedobacter sandarakinus]|uniref:DUF3667 domain-containing protein n=1 Tax=Pedobacter sandarakinus TaxID=353156 RepID=UPI0022487058|nr:DUF3667 domain-containing protein [Pedobacter sandarakinus]MCX2575380.1 DUF3667 domain-containing protein [Pedobacter sandarakinus]
MVITCKNCTTVFEGKFCNQCGQKASVSELTLHDVLHESWHAITHTDHGILKLVKDLFLRPKSVYLNYFAGQRKTYFSPVTFFLIMAAILLFLGVKIFDYEDYTTKEFNEFGRYALIETKFKTLLMLPFEILVTWVLFRRRYNLAKNIVFWLYLNGFLFTIQILLTPLYFAFISHKNTIDTFARLVQYLVLLTHLILVFANRKWINIILLLLVSNLIIIANHLLTGYLLFGNDMYQQSGATNFFELIIKAYTF